MGGTSAAEIATAAQPSQPTGGAEGTSESAATSTTALPVVPFWEAEVYEGQASDKKDFQIVFNIKEDEKDLFMVGSENEFTILLKDNPLPTIRHLRGITHFARNLKPGDKDYDLQQDFIGTDAKITPMVPLLNQCVSTASKDMYKRYVKEAKLNTKQRDAVFHAFTTNKGLTMIQGPPGTGKSFTDAVCASIGVILCMNIFVCAPSNVPVRRLVDTLIKERERLRKLDRKYPNSYDIIYFPTLITTKAELMMVQQMNSLSKCRMWWHIYNKFKADSKNTYHGSKKHKTAVKWMMLWNRVQKEIPLSQKDKTWYLKAAEWAAKVVLNNKTRPRIVVSTSNNGWKLKQWDVDFDLVIGDEWAFGTEADSVIAICLSP
jgi:hypothetical protein